MDTNGNRSFSGHRVLSLLGLLVALCAAQDASADSRFQARLNGEGATGLAIARWDETSRELTVSAETSGLVLSAVQVRRGAPGEVGPVLLRLAKAGTVWGGRMRLSHSLFRELMNARLHVSCLDGSSGAAEIRGQLEPSVFGLGHAPLGTSILEPVPGPVDRLRVRSPGTDSPGVRIDLGEAPGFTVRLGPLDAPEGATRTLTLLGRLDGVGDHPVMTHTIETLRSPRPGRPGAVRHIHDARAIGARLLEVAAYDESDRLLHRTVLPNGELFTTPVSSQAFNPREFTIQKTLDWSESRSVDPYKNFKFTVQFPSTGAAVFGDGFPVSDLSRIEVIPVDSDGSLLEVEAFTRAMITASEVPELLIAGASIAASGLRREALGAALLEPGLDGLALRNLGSSGADGVRLLPESGSSREISVELRRPADSPAWHRVRASARFSRVDEPGADLLSLDLERRDREGLRITPGAAPLALEPSWSVSVAVYRESVLIGVRELSAGPDGAGEIEPIRTRLEPGTGVWPQRIRFSAPPQASTSLLEADLEFDGAMAFRIGQDELIGDRLLFWIAAPTDAGSTRTEYGIEEVTLTHESLHTISYETASADLVSCVEPD